MKKKIILLFFSIFFSTFIFSQGKYRVITSKGRTIQAQSIRIQKKKNIIDILKIDGGTLRLKYSNIISIREIIPDWKYFNWKEEGFTDYVIVKTDSIKKEEMFLLVKNWIKETYNTPSEVIKAEINNSKIRIEALKQNLVYEMYLGSPDYMDATYSIEISVRNGRYKFDPIILKYYIPSSKYKEGKYVSIPINSESLSNFYIQKGKKKGEVKRHWRHLPQKVESHFNDLNIKLFKYIIENKKGRKSKLDSDDW